MTQTVLQSKILIFQKLRRVTFLTLLLFLSFQFIGVTADAVALKSKQFLRLDFVHEEKISKENAILLYESGKVRIWIFEDLHNGKLQPLEQEIEELGNEFNDYILPEIDSILSLPPDLTVVDIIFDDIKDETYYQGTKEQKKVSGFFSPELLGKNTILLDLNFNKAGLKSLKSNLVHEFVHLCQYYYDPFEDDFINEGIAQLFEQYLYGNRHLSSVYEFLRNPTDNLNNFKRTKIDYANSFLFFSYIDANFGGKSAIAKILKETRTGLAGIDHVLQQERETTFKSVFELYSLALHVNYSKQTPLLSIPGFNNATAAVKMVPPGEIFLPPYSSGYFSISTSHFRDLKRINDLDSNKVKSYYVGVTKRGNLFVQKTSKGITPNQVLKFEFLNWVLINPNSRAISL